MRIYFRLVGLVIFMVKLEGSADVWGNSCAYVQQFLKLYVGFWFEIITYFLFLSLCNLKKRDVHFIYLLFKLVFMNRIIPSFRRKVNTPHRHLTSSVIAVKCPSIISKKNR